MESAHETHFALAKTTRVALALRLDIGQERVQVDHPIVPWIVKPTVSVLNRSVIHDDGLNFFHRRYGKGPLPGLATFGGNVYFKADGKTFAAKERSRFGSTLRH